MAKHENGKLNFNITYFLSPTHTQRNEIANFGVVMTMWASLEMQKQGLYAKNHNGQVLNLPFAKTLWPFLDLCSLP